VLNYFYLKIQNDGLNLTIDSQDTAESLKVTVPYSFECLRAEYQKSKLLPLLVMLGSIGMVLDKPESASKFIQVVKELAEARLI
jgi:hypothetical protein